LSHIVSVVPPPSGQLRGPGFHARPAAAADSRFSGDESLPSALLSRLRALGDDLRDPAQRQPLVLLLLVAGGLVFSYWPGLLNAQSAWKNAQYSHGWLVPLFSLAIMFWWRRPIDTVAWSARLAGLLLLGASVGLRLLMAKYRIITIDMYSFVPALAGAALLCGGWGTVRWALGPIAFLIFMYPLPDEATRYLLGPLQTLATTVSTFAIQTLGVDAIREGNKIIVGERHLGVVDACSGLRMLTIFIALSVAIAMTGDQDWLDGIVIVLSSVPIALFVNAVRITVTGLMYTVNAELADKLFHDWAGYFMMPMALGLLFAEQKVLSLVRVSVEQDHGPTPLAAGELPAAGGRSSLAARVLRLVSFADRTSGAEIVRLSELRPAVGVGDRESGRAASAPGGRRAGGDSRVPPPVVVGGATRSRVGVVGDAAGPPPLVVPSLVVPSFVSKGPR
jgi:exosortase